MPGVAVASLVLAVGGLIASVVLLVPRQVPDRLAGPPSVALEPGWVRRGGGRRTRVDAVLGRWLERRLGPARVAAAADRLVAAGVPGRQAVHHHLGRRATHLAAATAAGLLVLAAGNPMVLVLGPLGTWLAGEGALDAAVRRRARQIDTALPDVLDVVAVLLSAGLGFREALSRVAEAMPGPVADELRHVLRQLGLGVGRREAFTHLRGRNRSDAFDTFVAALLQAEELGSPLSDAMITLAADLRRGAAQAARRLAAQTAPRVSLVLTTVIVPASLLLLVAGLLLGSGVDVGSFTGS